MLLARHVANDILSGARAPSDGAKEIWDLSVAPSTHMHELDAFVYWASEWDERPEDWPLMEKAIRCAARDL